MCNIFQIDTYSKIYLCIHYISKRVVFLSRCEGNESSHCLCVSLSSGSNKRDSAEWLESVHTGLLSTLTTTRLDSLTFLTDGKSLINGCWCTANGLAM